VKDFVWNIIKLLQEANETLQKANKELLERLTPPEVTGDIIGGAIRQLLTELFPIQSGDIYISDANYKITTIGELRRFIDWNDTNIFPYTSGYHDCDYFALAGDFAKYPEWSAFPMSFSYSLVKYYNWEGLH